MRGRAKSALARSDLVLWIGMWVVCLALLAWSFAWYGGGDSSPQAGDERPELTAPAFALTTQAGVGFDSSALEGQIWVADFVFTNCAGPCPIMTQNMSALQKFFAGRAGLQFVSITCDPKRDTPEALRTYAKKFEADLSNWTFLTGEYDDIQRIARGFLVSVANANEEGQSIGSGMDEVVPQDGPIVHSTRFILVDRTGTVVGSYQGTDADALDVLVAQIEGQLSARGAVYLRILPAVNASLNALAGVLLIVGLVFVKQGHIRRHKYTMVSAFVVSFVFLTTYVTYHTLRQMSEGVGHTAWEVDGFWRPVYYTILISHVLLAAAVPFLAVRTLWLGIRDDIARHRKWARVTWPIWMYVSVTGVIVYLMLYHLHPALMAP